jgi:hypothetical protein
MKPTDLKLIRQERTINEIKGILIVNKTSDEIIALIEVDQLIQFYNFNDGLSIQVINTIVEVAKNFSIIYEGLK